MGLGHCKWPEVSNGIDVQLPKPSIEVSRLKFSDEVPIRVRKGLPHVSQDVSRGFVVAACRKDLKTAVKLTAGHNGRKEFTVSHDTPLSHDWQPECQRAFSVATNTLTALGAARQRE